MTGGRLRRWLKRRIVFGWGRRRRRQWRESPPPRYPGMGSDLQRMQAEQAMFDGGPVEPWGRPGSRDD